MKHCKFVIVGAGSAGRTAVETLAEEAQGGSILIIDAEDNLPYKRTNVSKNVKAGYKPDDFAVHEKEWYRDNGVELMKGQAVIRTDPGAHTLTLESGSLSYSSLLLATGARPRVPFTMPPGNWTTLWTAGDGLALHEKLTGLNKIAVVGIGVLGVEAAWQISMAGLETILVGCDTRPMMKYLDQVTADPLETAVRKSGITLNLERAVLGITGHPEAEGIVLETDKGPLEADFTVLTVGAKPESSLARSSGIRVGTGILVDSGLKTSAPDVWAAGDCAEHPGGLVTGLWHSAEHQGHLAALGMLGRYTKNDNPPYRLKCEVFGGFWFSAGPVNAPVGTDGLGPAETRESKGIIWSLRFRNGKIAAIAAAAPSGMEKSDAKTVQKLLLAGAGRDEVHSVLFDRSPALR